MSTENTTTDPQDELTTPQQEPAPEQPEAVASDDQADGEQQDQPDEQPEEDKEPVDWAKFTKTRSEAAGLRRRLRDTEQERDQSLEKITELEAQVQQLQAVQEQGTADNLREQMLTDRGLPASALPLVTGTTEQEISDELNRIEKVFATPSPDGPVLHGTRGEPAPSEDWSSIVKGR